MTPIEHKKIATALRSKITKQRNKSKGDMCLSDKLKEKQILKQLEDQLHDHLINYYDLVY